MKRSPSRADRDRPHRVGPRAARGATRRVGPPSIGLRARAKIGECRLGPLSTAAAVAVGAVAAGTSCQGAREDAPAGVPGAENENVGSDPDSLRLDVGGPSGCAPGRCTEIDVLFVIDNSGTMGEEQLNLAANFPLLVDRLEALTDRDGRPVNPSVHVMVTTTDMGHPLCSPFERVDYEPRRGAPVYQGCNARITRFTGLPPDSGEAPQVVEEACTQHCPADRTPANVFIHFDPVTTNVPGDAIAQALSCIAPQGIDGCGYESPLESMLQALNPTACWNAPQQPHCRDDDEWGWVASGFLREEATLAVVIVTDEADCSVAYPGGFTFFVEDETYWAEHPDDGTPKASSAVCWNAGVECDEPDDDGVYARCSSTDGRDVLHPVDRYVRYLRWLREERGQDVIMLGVLGVPPVTQHNPMPPFEPLEGGVEALVYRDWAPSDLTPDELAAGVTVGSKRFEFGPVAPGCRGVDADGGVTGQAIAPVRIRDVCESLNFIDQEGVEQVRCCIESICDRDFSTAIECLVGIVGASVTAPR